MIAVSSEKHVYVVVKRNKGYDVSVESDAPPDDESGEDHLSHYLEESQHITKPYLALTDRGIAVGIICCYDDVIKGKLPDAHDMEKENHHNMNHDYGNRKNLQDFLVIDAVRSGYDTDYGTSFLLFRCVFQMSLRRLFS